jgi:uncharacterized membrane protein
MNPTALFAITMASICGVTLAVPSLSPARFLFGVRVGAPFRKTGPGRQALRIYYAHDVTGIAIAIALVFALGLHREWTWMLAVLLAEAAAVLGYYRAHRRLRPYAAPAEAAGVREADLFAAEDRLPRWTLWAIPPFLLPMAGAAYLRAHWNEIPARIATHYRTDGQPNGWTTRTPLHVYGLLIFAAGLMLWIFLTGVVVYFGARRSPGRRKTLGIAISVMCLMGTVFTSVGVGMAHPFPVWIPIAVLPPYLAGVLYWSLRGGSDPVAPADSSPDECWSLGDVYNNPNDAALFVPKRVGSGYTINFGHPDAKWLAIGFLGGMGLLVAFLFWTMT